MGGDTDRFREQLRQKGYKLTLQRQAVLKTLEHHEGEHLSTEEIYAFVKEDQPDIGIATVYRTLILLSDMELIIKLDFGDGLSRYELNRHREDHRHHHLICLGCGGVTGVEMDLLEALEEQIQIKNGFIVKDHRLQFYGYCKKCSDGLVQEKPCKEE